MEGLGVTREQRAVIARFSSEAIDSEAMPERHSWSSKVAMMLGLMTGSKRCALRAAQKVRQPPEGTDGPRRPGRRGILKRHGVSLGLALVLLAGRGAAVHAAAFDLAIPGASGPLPSKALTEWFDARHAQYCKTARAFMHSLACDAQRLT